MLCTTFTCSNISADKIGLARGLESSAKKYEFVRGNAGPEKNWNKRGIASAAGEERWPFAPLLVGHASIS